MGPTTGLRRGSVMCPEAQLCGEFVECALRRKCSTDGNLTRPGSSPHKERLHAIAKNEARKSWRRHRTISLESIQDHEAIERIDGDVTATAREHSELCLQMRNALRKIPPIYRRVLTDHFILGHSVRDIARRHRVPMGTVLSRIFTGKRILRGNRILQQAWKS